VSLVLDLRVQAYLCIFLKTAVLNTVYGWGRGEWVGWLVGRWGAITTLLGDMVGG